MKNKYLCWRSSEICAAAWLFIKLSSVLREKLSVQAEVERSVVSNLTFDQRVMKLTRHSAADNIVSAFVL